MQMRDVQARKAGVLTSHNRDGNSVEEFKHSSEHEPFPPWRIRAYPEKSLSALAPGQNGRMAYPPTHSTSNRVDFSAFINSMDDASIAYLSLLREYASRPLQGKALEYHCLYKAMVSQQAWHEDNSRISVIEFTGGALRSKTFTSYQDFKMYLEHSLSDTSMRILVVLEDLPVRFVCLLGSRLRINPTIFARHYSVGDNSLISEDIAACPSVQQTSTQDGLEYESDDELLHVPAKRQSFTLRYPIVMPHVSAKQHPDPQRCPPWLKPNERLRDRSAYPQFVVERLLAMAAKSDKWDTRGDVSELEGQVTYWSHSSPKGGYHGTCRRSKVGLRGQN